MLQVLGQVATCQLDAAAVRAWDHIKCTGREMALSEKANQRHIHVTFDLFQSHKTLLFIVTVKWSAITPANATEIQVEDN